MFYTNVIIKNNTMHHIGYDDNGKKFIKEEKFKSYIGIECDKSEATHKTIYNIPVKLKYFNTIKDQKNYVKNNSEMLNLHDNIDVEYQFINSVYKDNIKFDQKLIKVFLYDIETSKDPVTGKWSKPHEANGEITSITFKDVVNKNIFCFSTVKFYQEQMEIKINGKLYYKYFNTEEELLKSIVIFLNKMQPDILTGYNSESFDDPYIINRIKNILGENYLKKLSVNGDVYSKEKYDEKTNRYSFYNHIGGISLIDYMLIYQKYVGKYESNTLNYVSSVELGDSKVDYEEYDDLEDLRINNPQKYVEYSIYDVELLWMIEQKRKLINVICSQAYISKSLYHDIMSPVKTWDNFIYSGLVRDNVVIPPRKELPDQFSIPGGYVKSDTIAGIYDNCVTVDLRALYPSALISCNICYSTLIQNRIHKVNLNKIDDRLVNKELKLDNNYITAGSGYMFKKDVDGVLPKFFKYLLDTRSKTKNEMLKLDKIYQKFKGTEEDKFKLKNEIDNRSSYEQALKLLANSGYGALCNNWCRYKDSRLAASITLTGQLAVKYAVKHIEKYLFKKYGKKNTCIFTHTDSGVFCLDGIVKNGKDYQETADIIDEFCKKEIEPELLKCYEELSSYLNLKYNLLYMKREKICPHFLMSSGPRYAALVIDKEGVRYEEPKLQVTGMEIVRSSTPSAIKPWLKECLIKMMKREPLQDYINDCRIKFNLMDVKDIAFPRGINNIYGYEMETGYKPSTPIHVRASINHNRYLRKHENEYPNLVEINDGDKIKFIYIMTPNPFENQNVIGFHKNLFNKKFDCYVDRRMQFNKTFSGVIEEIANRIGQPTRHKKIDLGSIFK